MNFNSPIPRGQQPFLREGSKLASPSDSRSMGQMWKTANAMGAQAAGMANAASNAARRLAKVRRGSVVADPHPFMITVGPDYKIRIRGGDVLGYGFAEGTDGQKDPSLAVETYYSSCDPKSTVASMAGYDVWLPRTAGVVDDGNYFVWLEWKTGYARVLFGPDATADTGDDGAPTPGHSWDHTTAPWDDISAWSGYPKRDSNHALIAIINVNKTRGYPTIRQYIESDYDPVGAIPGQFQWFVYHGITEVAHDPLLASISCHTWDPFTGTEGTDDDMVMVALTPMLAAKDAEYSLRLSGVITYDNTDWANGHRIATLPDATAEHQFITPPFQQTWTDGGTVYRGNVIRAESLATNIYVDGVQVMWQLHDARHWATDPTWT